MDDSMERNALSEATGENFLMGVGVGVEVGVGVGTTGVGFFRVSVVARSVPPIIAKTMTVIIIIFFVMKGGFSYTGFGCSGMAGIGATGCSFEIWFCVNIGVDDGVSICVLINISNCFP